MGSIIISYLDDENEPFAFSMPPHTDGDGSVREAQIVVHPWGPTIPDGNALDLPAPHIEKAQIAMHYTLSEAEALATTILRLVESAKAGNYSEVGQALIERHTDKA